MADLTVNKFSGGSVAETLVAAGAGGDAIPNYTGKQFLVVKNAHATLSRTVTFNSGENCNQGVDHDIAVVVAALTTRIIKVPNPPSRFQNASKALPWTYSSEADLTVGAFEWPE